MSRYACLADWLNWQETLHPNEIDLGLKRTAEVLQRLGLQFTCPVITVAGTNGKGSTLAFLDAIYTAAGYRTAVYTSPHLLRYNERITVAGVEASDALLCDAFARVDDARGDISLTYFEFGTLAALEIFANAQPDVVLLEVGLGGRLDATNVIAPDIAVITSIAIDHTQWLGDTREAIGLEKAGIFRANRAAVIGDPDPPSTLLQQAEALGVELSLIERDFGFLTQGASWDYHSDVADMTELPMPTARGRFQFYNAATALRVCQLLHSQLPCQRPAFERGIASAFVAGRLQKIADAPLTLVDVAHNPEAAHSLSTWLEETPCAGHTIGLFGVLDDKDIESIVEALAEVIDHWVVVQLDVVRAASASRVATIVEQTTGRAPTHAGLSVEQALSAVREFASSEDRIVIFGSFYTVAKALQQ